MQPHNRSLGFNILVLSLTFLAVTFCFWLYYGQKHPLLAMFLVISHNMLPKVWDIRW